MELLSLGGSPMQANEGGIELFDVRGRCRGWKQQGIVVERAKRTQENDQKLRRRGRGMMRGKIRGGVEEVGRVTIA